MRLFQLINLRTVSNCLIKAAAAPRSGQEGGVSRFLEAAESNTSTTLKTQSGNAPFVVPVNINKLCFHS